MASSGVCFLGTLQSRAKINGLERTARLGFGAQSSNGAHAVLLSNPAGDSALIDPKGFGGLGLSTEVLNQGLEDVHFEPSYWCSYKLAYREASLQGYGSARNTHVMELKDRLKQARKHAGLTQTQLADAVGITQPSITDLERGKSQKTGYIAQIAKACRVSALWLASGEGEMVPSAYDADGNLRLDKPWLDLQSHHANVVEIQQPHRLAKEYPLISWVAAGSWQESCDNFVPGSADEWLLSNENAGPHGYWLQVKGPSMQPTFTEGMRILVKPEGFDLVSGKYYIAAIDEPGKARETTFKQYVRDGGAEFLRPLNEAFPVLRIDERVRIIGQVIDGKLPPIF